MAWYIDLIEYFFAFQLYRMSPDPVKCLVEEVGSNSGSIDQGISHYRIMRSTEIGRASYSSLCANEE